MKTKNFLINGDCIEELKTLPDKSVDFFYLDLPYGETNCKWDKIIDMKQLWKELWRLSRHKRVAYVFSCSTKFGYKLIKSWEKGFKMDLVWKKRNKTGGIYSRYRPMKNHEMVYFFYRKAPKYNRDKYHKRIKQTKKVPNKKEADKTGFGWAKMKGGQSNSFKPPNPASVIETDKTIPSDKYKSSVYGGTGKEGFGATYSPPNPASVIETDIYGETQAEQKKRGKKYGAVFNPPNPASVIERDASCVYGVGKDKEWNFTGKKGYGAFEPPNPASVIETDKLTIYEKYKEKEWFSPVEEVKINKEYSSKQDKVDDTSQILLDDNFNPEFEEEDVAPTFIPAPAPPPVSIFASKKVFIGKRFHQTQKPLDLMEFLLKYWTDEGDVVLDATMGSGSMGVMCKKMDRTFIGIEKDPDIFKVAVDRIEKTEKLIKI